jgi:hypothetical protein
MIEHCCEQLLEAVDGDAIVNQPKLQMRGRILNEIDSDYASAEFVSHQLLSFLWTRDIADHLERGEEEVTAALSCARERNIR